MTDQPEQPAADDENFELTITFSYEPDGTAQDLFGVSEETLLDVVGATLERVGIAESVEISVLVSDDTGIQRLNREYRGRDEATDVLSFPLLDAPIADAPADQLWSTALSDDADSDASDDADADLDTLIAELDAAGGAAGMPAGATDAAGETGKTATAGADGADATDIFVLQDIGDDDALDAFIAVDGDDDSENWPLHLGDIALSRDAVIRQAQQAGHSAAWECAYLVAHSVLHLVGYDDQTDAGYRAMVAHQEAALAEVGVPR
ncbi:MAG: rRNA maturation RNase YbeY [Ktedonobacterales bacterium]